MSLIFHHKLGNWLESVFVADRTDIVGHLDHWFSPRNHLPLNSCFKLLFKNGFDKKTVSFLNVRETSGDLWYMTLYPGERKSKVLIYPGVSIQKDICINIQIFTVIIWRLCEHLAKRTDLTLCKNTDLKSRIPGFVSPEISRYLFSNVETKKYDTDIQTDIKTWS